MSDLNTDLSYSLLSGLPKGMEFLSPCRNEQHDVPTEIARQLLTQVHINIILGLKMPAIVILHCSII